MAFYKTFTPVYEEPHEQPVTMQQTFALPAEQFLMHWAMHWNETGYSTTIGAGTFTGHLVLNKKQNTNST